MDNFETILADYKEYCQHYWNTVYDQETFLEVTGGVSDYDTYLSLAYNKLLPLGAWYEHSNNVPLPESLAGNSQDKYSKM